LAHLAVLALLGYIFAELSLINFYKVPFTCSYLPGKTNIQVAFFGFIFVFLILAISFAPFEVRSLNDPALFASTMGAFLTLAIALWLFNRHRARSAVLYFEELPEVLIQTLGLGAIRPSDADLPSGRISAAGE
jgi:hypothetical protein